METQSNKLTIIAFAIINLECLAIFFMNYNITALVVFVVTFSARTFALTAGYHRYFAYKTFQTSQVFQFILALIGT